MKVYELHNSFVIRREVEGKELSWTYYGCSKKEALRQFKLFLDKYMAKNFIEHGAVTYHDSKFNDGSLLHRHFFNENHEEIGYYSHDFYSIVLFKKPRKWGFQRLELPISNIG